MTSCTVQSHSTHAVHMLCECTGCKLQYKTHDTERNFSWLSSALTKLPGSLGHVFSKSFNTTIDFWARGRKRVVCPERETM